MSKTVNFESCSILKHCELVSSGVRPYTNQKKYVATGDVINNKIVSSTDYSYEGRPSRANMKSNANDVLFAKMMATTKVLLITPNIQSYIFSTGFAVLRPNIAILKPKYVMHICKSKEFQKIKDKFAYGSTQRAINNKSIEKIGLVVPTLHEQDKASNILDCIERINDNRCRALELIKQIAQSIFAKTYNAKTFTKWPEESVGNLCYKIKRYPTFYGLKYVDNGVPVVKIGNITETGKLQTRLDCYDFITKDVSDKFPETILEYRDLLMAVRGDGSAGKLGYVSDKKFIGANISPNILRINVNHQRVSPIFLLHLLSSNYGKSLINSIITRSVKKAISATNFKNLKIRLPPLHLQHSFENKIRELDKQLKHSQDAYAHSQQLLENVRANLLQVRLFD